MMKPSHFLTIFSLITVFTFPNTVTTAYAQAKTADDHKAKLKDLNELLNVNGMFSNIQRMFPKDLNKAFSKGKSDAAALQKDETEVTTFLISLYDKYYTHDEVKQMLQFQKSPVGQKAQKVTPDIMRELMTYIMEKTQKR